MKKLLSIIICLSIFLTMPSQVLATTDNLNVQFDSTVNYNNSYYNIQEKTSEGSFSLSDVNKNNAMEEGFISFSWNSITGASYYKFKFRNISKGTSWSSYYQTTKRSVTLLGTGIIPGDIYEVWLGAYNQSNGLITSVSVTEEAQPVTNYESAWFPVSVMNITQIAYESYSHGNSNHIDCVGATYAFAPFTGKVVDVSKSFGVALFQSIDKVYYPDGTLDYMTVLFMHGSNYEHWKSCYDNETIISQGTDFYKIGGVGSGGVVEYGLHYDIGVYKGKTNTLPSYYSTLGNTYAFDAFYINPEKTTSIIKKGKVKPGNTVSNGAPTDWGNLWIDLDS